MALVDAKDAQQDGRLSAVEGRASDLESIKLDARTFDEKMALVDAKDAEQDIRLTKVEGRVSTLETDLSTRVQAEIDDKVSQVVFDSVKAQLENTDSTLAAALATKVAATVQVQVDDAQNALINSKVAQADYDVKVAAIDAKDGEQDVRLTALEADKVNVVEYVADKAVLSDKDYFLENRFLAIYEFIQAMLNTYCITKPDGNLYEFTAELQKLPTAPAYFKPIGKQSNQDVIIEVSDLLMKTMLGDFVVMSASGHMLVQVLSKDVSGSALQLKAEHEFKSDDFPLAISYRDSREVPVFTFELTRDTFAGLKSAAV
jgi:hypothetical protein